MHKLTLYLTECCHLCEDAKALLLPLIDKKAIALNCVDISESDIFIKQYGTRIPVLRCEKTQQELNWPFAAEDISNFLD